MKLVFLILFSALSFAGPSPSPVPPPKPEPLILNRFVEVCRFDKETKTAKCSPEATADQVASQLFQQLLTNNAAYNDEITACVRRVKELETKLIAPSPSPAPSPKAPLLEKKLD